MVEETSRTAKEITLSTDIEPDLPWVCADPTRVRQILIILLDNAIKFTPMNGQVKVRAQLLDQDPNLLVLRVTDTGCGIAEGMTEQIFERLFQASDPAQAGRQGLGLGLHICKELVLRQGGRVWATSTPGRGAVLSVTLPVFSMRNLLAPALKRSGGVPTRLMLLVAQIDAPGGWLSDASRAEHSQSAREFLERCLQSDQDVLLPKMGSSGAAELYFVVAATDAAGADSLIRRIRQKFDERELHQKVGLVLSTSAHAIDVPGRDAGDLMGNSLDQVAATIQALVNEQLSSRMVASG